MPLLRSHFNAAINIITSAKEVLFCLGFSVSRITPAIVNEFLRNFISGSTLGLEAVS